jgi:hypothetical protein
MAKRFRPLGTQFPRLTGEKELETGLTASKVRIFHLIAGVAQLVEHFLAKEDVARSSRVTRFLFSLP